MYQAIGVRTGDVYASGEDKRECMRLLDKNYRETSRKKMLGRNDLTQDSLIIYPEPLVIVKGSLIN